MLSNRKKYITKIYFFYYYWPIEVLLQILSLSKKYIGAGNPEMKNPHKSVFTYIEKNCEFFGLFTFKRRSEVMVIQMQIKVKTDKFLLLP